MASDMYIDMSHLAEVADEVERTKRPRTVGIRRGVVAVLKPATRKVARPVRREPTAEDVAAFEAAAGGWADVDTDRFVTDAYKSRRIATRPPSSYDLLDRH